MDLIKIGRYIAGKRKELGMTQKQLAEKIGMSDKSVSKWERGVCLPDVSVYSELCQILGISINEFLAGEDLSQELIVQKSEENLIGITRDSKNKQKRLKIIIGMLLVISILTVSAIGNAVYRAHQPKNYIEPVPGDSAVMQAVNLLNSPDEAHLYQFTTTDDYKTLRLSYYTYHDGEIIDKDHMEIGFQDTGSPKNGEILIMPDFKNYQVKVVVSTENGKYTTEIPILEGVAEREYYGRSATRIEGQTRILYDSEQPLVALIYDNDEMHVVDIYDLLSGETPVLKDNDYMYLFSYEFCKE